MKVEIDIRKTVEQNAADYFEHAKRLRKKKEGVLKILEHARQELRKIPEIEQAERSPFEYKTEKIPDTRKWYEKFRWFISSEGFLCIGGRDATSNEIVIKKHADPSDVVFHTDLAGSPFFVVKSGGKTVGQKTIEEAANATASYSRAWKLGLSMLDVFYVRPDQVTKEAKAGEYLTKGAFMIYGKKNFVSGDVRLSIGRLKDGSGLMCAPASAVEENCQRPFLHIIPGDRKPSDIAKRINKSFGQDLDAIIRLMPSGNSQFA